MLENFLSVRIRQEVGIILEVQFETDSAKGSWNIIVPANLIALKITFEDIKKIEPAFFSFPDNLYTEQNVASPLHPCGGSLGVYVIGKDDILRSVEEIFYYDYNVNKDHCNGKPHWNHERRFNDGKKTWRESKVELHIIPDSPSITVRLLDSKGNVIKEKTVNRVPLNKVRQK